MNIINPEIIVTYLVSRISGFHDHLVIHLIVKRVFLDMKNKGNKSTKRLVFFTINKDEDDKVNAAATHIDLTFQEMKKPIVLSD